MQILRPFYRPWIVIRVVGLTVSYTAMPYNVPTLQALRRSNQVDQSDIKKVYAPHRFGAIKRALGLYGKYDWPNGIPPSSHGFFRDIDGYMAMAIMDALEQCDYNQRLTAKHLGIMPRKLNYYIKKYSITHPKWRVHREANVIAI